MKNKSSLIKAKKDIFTELFSKQLDRMLEFSLEDRLGYKCYFNAYIGLEDEDTYNHTLYLLNKKSQSYSNTLIFNGHIESLDNIELINILRLKLSKINLSNIEKEDITIVNDVDTNLRIRKALDEILRFAQGAFTNESLKINFIIKLLVWSKSYLEKIKWTKEDTPKCIYYGDIKKHESYFLYLLHLIGFDVLYLNPKGTSQIGILNTTKQLVEIQEYACIQVDKGFEERLKDGEMIDKSIIKKSVTNAAQVSKQVSKALYKEAGVIKPWELQNRYLNTILLSSTFDEIEIYWKEPVKLRPGFNVQEQSVEVPVFFAKINGIYQDVQQYNRFLNQLRGAEYTLCVEWEDTLAKLAKPFVREAYRLSYMFDDKGTIDKEKIVNNKEFTIATLKRSLQYLFVDKIQEVFDSHYFIDPLTKDDKVKALYSLLNPCSDILLLIENFDYSDINPKLILYIKDRIVFTKEYACLLLLLNKLGFDVIVCCPCGASNIENIINEGLIDNHRLETTELNLALNTNTTSETSISNLFKNLFKIRR